MKAIDRETKKWIRTAADEKAAGAGMRFDVERGEFVCTWIEGHCCLYEGEQAGQPISLYPAQREFLMRLFGWVQWSEDWGQWIRRFTHASLWMAKKNGKSPIAAAYNLYMLCGDGEPGQKVYMMAHGGQQARIAQMHAINMVKQSPALNCEQGGDCKVNNTTLLITHLPSNSVIQVVTGDDQRSADAKHGYNGSVTIDEMHVVTRVMLTAVGRAGISRKEPLQTSFSTAGADPSSPGFERCEYGRQVNSGERDDPHFLHVEYAAPQTATAADIEANLDAYGKAANPGWGFTIKPSEFRADWKKSKGKPRDLATFMFERLDIWVSSTNQWLDVAGWEKGKRDITREMLRGRECYAGLDLSRTRDMTSAVFLFPWPEEGPDALFLYPMFWLPQKTIEDREHLFPFRSWLTAGDIREITGDVVSYGTVEADIIAEVSELRLRVQNIFFDQTYAEDVTARLVGAIGCERTAVGQTLMVLTGLCKEFERRVQSGRVLHAGNRVMTWQVGHVEVKSDANNNIRPVKPKEKSGKSIDGVMATIDAMAGVMQHRPSGDSGGFEAW